MKFEIGKTYHIYNGYVYKIHIRAIIDDKYVVYRWYGKHKQWWHYQIERKDILEIYVDKYKEAMWDKNPLPIPV